MSTNIQSPFSSPISSIPVPVSQGGTGQSTAAAAFTALAAGQLPIFRQTSAAATPSATLNVFGSPVTVSADAGFTGFAVFLFTFTTSGVATETVTVQAVTTYSDNTTSTQAALATTTSNGTTSGSVNATGLLMTGGDGKTVKSVAFSVKSSINSSAASVTFTLTGVSQP